MSRTEFIKARDELAIRDKDTDFPIISDEFIEGADWAYEWLHDIHVTLNGYINGRDKYINELKKENKDIGQALDLAGIREMELKKKLAIAVEALEKECWCADNKAEDCKACIALAKIKGDNND